MALSNFHPLPKANYWRNWKSAARTIQGRIIRPTRLTALPIDGHWWWSSVSCPYQSISVQFVNFNALAQNEMANKHARNLLCENKINEMNEFALRTFFSRRIYSKSETFGAVSVSVLILQSTRDVSLCWNASGR